MGRPRRHACEELAKISAQAVRTCAASPRSASFLPLQWNLGRRLPERSHPNATGLDDREIAGPIFASGDQARPAVVPPPPASASASAATRHHGCAAAPILASSPKSLSKVSKIRCSRSAHAKIRVGHARRNGSDPQDIVPGCRQGVDRSGRKILVGKKTQNQAALGNTFSELSGSRA